jgi:hypothetical protein
MLALDEALLQEHRQVPKKLGARAMAAELSALRRDSGGRSQRYFFRAAFVFPLVKRGVALLLVDALAPPPRLEDSATRNG